MYFLQIVFNVENKIRLVKGTFKPLLTDYRTYVFTILCHKYIPWLNSLKLLVAKWGFDPGCFASPVISGHNIPKVLSTAT